MADKKKVKSKALTKAGGSKSLAKYSYEDEMAKYAKEAAESETLPAGNFASFKGGFFIGGNRMKDDKADTVVLGYIMENDMYVGKYDSDEQKPPTCFAFGTKEEEMRPSKNAIGYWDADEKKFIKPDSCVGCPMNEWGSANTGKGKACQNRRRLAFISANGADDADYIKTAELVQLKLPVTSVKGWKSYVHAVAAQGLHPSFVVTTIERHDDEKTQFKAAFQMGAALGPELLPALKERRAEVATLIAAEYPVWDEDEAVLAANPPKGGKRGKPVKGGKF